ncbi:MAG: hypothetical protein AAB903_00660 [Patescibacteria group bacterium]
MILSLIGPDDYRREKRKRYFIEEFKKKYSVHGVERFLVSTKDGREKFHELVISPSLFSTKRLAVIEEVFETDEKSFFEDLKRALKDPSLWVFISERDKIPAAFKFLTKDPVTAEEFPFLEGESWKKFILHEAKLRGINLEPEALRLLASLYKEDSWRLVTELDRLSAEGTSSIGAKEIREENSQASFNLWGVLGELRSPTIERRLYALEKVFESQEPAAKIFNIMAAQAGPMISRFADWDIDIKSGKLEYEEILLEFVLG